jgi:hypothetical protein
MRGKSPGCFAFFGGGTADDDLPFEHRKFDIA